jgi:hypothetical protein
MIDGPGPPATLRITGTPTVLDPLIRWALILRADAFGVLRETQRILLLRRGLGGDTSG